MVENVENISEHGELVYILRVQLMPLIMKNLSEKASFAQLVRTLRIFRLLISRLLSAMATEVEMALSLINHMLESESSAGWKRALCLELWRGIHNEAALVRCMYAAYDEQNGKRSIIRDHLAILVRLASEKPTVIGLGQRSSVPGFERSGSDEQATIQAGSVAGTIGVPTTEPDSNSTGISTKWSTIRVPCLDQVDKPEAPSLPASYIYSLVLSCLTNFSEGLAKFLLPFTVPPAVKPKRRRQTGEQPTQTSAAEEGVPAKNSALLQKQPINPLKLTDHVLYSQISTSGQMVEHCWPALLATSSTFLNAKLDSDFYHALIRSFQKFTQVAGLLDLATPRDAFLTTLGKYAVPPANAGSLARSPTLPNSKNYDSDQIDSHSGSDRDTSPTPTNGPRKSQDRSAISISSRNLLCLRALLNLGTALGPILHQSWSIILEALHQVDILLARSEEPSRKGDRQASQSLQELPPSDAVTSELKAERLAVDTAVSRMFESTSSLSDIAFVENLKCLCKLLQGPSSQSEDGERQGSQHLLSPQNATPRHYRFPSVSSIRNDSYAFTQGSCLVLERLALLAKCNTARLSHAKPSESGWDILLIVLTKELSFSAFPAEVRVKAAGVLYEIVIDIIRYQDVESTQERDDITGRCLDSLLKVVSSLWHLSETKGALNCDVEIHMQGLDTLRTILENCGDDLHQGWDIVFTVISSIFGMLPVIVDRTTPHTQDLTPKSPKLVRSSFESLQLICSDFLASVPPSFFPMLLDTQYSFCSQELDLNISLTVSKAKIWPLEFKVMTAYLDHDIPP